MIRVAYETAKIELAQASSLSERATAVENALVQGMPLAAIEAYLDWLDAVRPLPDSAWSDPAAEPNEVTLEDGSDAPSDTSGEATAEPIGSGPTDPGGSTPERSSGEQAAEGP